jgi:hypothetical protein
MTEEQATTKWCPYTRVAPSDMGAKDDDKSFNVPNGAPVCNRIQVAGSKRPGMTHAMNCIASACMAWRWDDELLPKPHRLSQGHCGLAGKP